MVYPPLGSAFTFTLPASTLTVSDFGSIPQLSSTWRKSSVNLTWGPLQARAGNAMRAVAPATMITVFSTAPLLFILPNIVGILEAQAPRANSSVRVTPKQLLHAGP